MLNQMEPGISKSILENIEKEDPKMALAIRNLMFTFEDLIGVPEAGIRELLGQLDKKTLALALRGRAKTEESDIQVHVDARCRHAQGRYGDHGRGARAGCGAGAARDVDIARRLESEGKLVLGAEDQDEYVV